MRWYRKLVASTVVHVPWQTGNKRAGKPASVLEQAKRPKVLPSRGHGRNYRSLERLVFRETWFAFRNTLNNEEHACFVASRHTEQLEHPPIGVFLCPGLSVLVELNV